MRRFATPILLAALLAAGWTQAPAAAREKSEVGKGEKETRYLAFQIFTYGPDPKMASMGEGKNAVARFPDRATLRDYILDIKRRIGAVGGPKTRLAVILGHLSFDHGDAEVVGFIGLAFRLALETDVAVGFHVDDSMFWAKRKDLWGDPKNVEALDWDGTPCTGRRLDWQTGPGAKPDAAPPQMCFNSKRIRQEVRQRAALLGKAVVAGVKLLQQRERPELFAGVIAGSETMIGQDFKTGKYLGYRALLNKGFSRARPPADMDAEREKIVQEFIETWTTGLAGAGVPPQRIYSHTAFLSRRVFKLGNNKAVTYSRQNHFAPPSVAFGKHHRPGFSTYPQPGLFDDIYEELARHKQVGWASCEGTNLQLGSGPGQSGMTMETYLAKTFNHGGTLVNLFSWGIGGEANRKMSFRVVTEGEEALRAYRKFLKGEPLIEAKTETLTLLERLPPKIHKIQEELPAWVRKTGNAARAGPLMKQLETHLKAKNFDEAERTADAILKMMGVRAPSAARGVPEEAGSKLRHQLGGPFLVSRDKVQEELKLTAGQRTKLEKHFRELLPNAMSFFQEIEGLKPEEREKKLGSYRQKAQGKLAAVLAETLTEGQRKRLRQLVLQREGLFGGGEVLNELRITDEQKKQFVAEIRRAQEKIGPLMKEAQKGKNIKEIQSRVLKIRKDLQGELEALLTGAQKKQWKDMLGKPAALGDLFDLSSR